jgi:methylated-DNA-protein-cysteine methyltransferase-like protein
MTPRTKTGKMRDDAAAAAPKPRRASSREARARDASPPDASPPDASSDDASAEEARQGRWERFYAVVRRIPRGKVATYGQVAELAGLPGHARQVGYALHALRSAHAVPWHRVVNAQGRLSLGADVAGGQIRQRFRLEEEGVEFHPNGSLSLARYGWKPRRPKPAAKDDDGDE